MKHFADLAYFKIIPDFHLKNSNVSTVFVPVARKKDRSKFLQKVDDKVIPPGMEVIQVEGREGYFVEKYDIVSKFERLEDHIKDTKLSFSHFAKMYQPSWKGEDGDDSDNEDEHSLEVEVEKDFEEESSIDQQYSKFDYVMQCTKPVSGASHEVCKHTRGPRLPKILKLKTIFPGEPPFMRKRSRPVCLRFHKFKPDSHFESFLFSQALLYKPFKCEEDLEKELMNVDKNNVELLNSEIQCVKSQVMEYLEDVQEARFFVEEAIQTEEIGNTLDPEGEKDKKECEYEGVIEHPDFPEFDPGIFEEDDKKGAAEKCYRPIEIDNLEILMEKSKNLDFFQKKVIEKGIHYARDVVKGIKSWNKTPDASLLMVHGGAGSGKSTVINILKQWVSIILQKSGHNPEDPFVLVTAPTGTAAANIRGQTLHTALGFNFGNQHHSLSDKKRDEKRTHLQNLRLVIIDEISMVKADLLYQLDMRLKEIMQKPTKAFGQVAIFAFGDMLQLRPPRANFIFEEPKCQDYHLSYHSASLWHSFEVINLVENHRQDSDRYYAEILNRIRVGLKSENDMEVLKSRIKQAGHQDLDGAMYLNATNLEVEHHNNIGLNKLDSELVVSEAINIHPSIKNFKPKINKNGNIGTLNNETPFRQTLQMKVGARVMITYNIDVTDCLTNGTRGRIVAFKYNTGGKLEKVIIMFDETCQGEYKRSIDKETTSKYPGCTAIDRIMYQYSIGRNKGQASSSARVIQFPLRLCFATTSHKFQGQTVVKPLKLAIDLRRCFDAAQAYVMLSRVQCLSQLFILEELPETKIRADKQALIELERLNEISINNNSPKWEQGLHNGIKIVSLNCQSIQKHFYHISQDSMILFADIIFLSETWLQPDASLHSLEIPSYTLHANSVGRGKGLATYINNKFRHDCDIREPNFQITKVNSNQLDVISVYRSKEGSLQVLVEKLFGIICGRKTTVICGDFNVCLKSTHSNPLDKNLKQQGFQQLVRKATHIRGGLIDQIYVRQGEEPMASEVQHYCPYYSATDHDALLHVLEAN